MENVKQPKALAICFLTEMWERFGYLLIQTLLIFVLLKTYNFSSVQAGEIVGAFTGLIYVTSVLAGYIADYFLGYFRTVILGSILLFAGYLIVSIVFGSMFYLALSLSFICVGTGLLKTNVSGFLGGFYEFEDSRRSKGFTIFYIGINTGPIIAAVISSLIQQHGNITQYQHIFLLSAFSALLAGAFFFFGLKIKKITINTPKLSINKILCASVLIIASIIICMFVLYSPKIALSFFFIITICCIASLLISSKGRPNQMKKTFIYIIYLIIGVLYFALYWQIFISINLFNEIAVNGRILGINFTPQMFVAIDNAGIIIFGLVALILWNYINDTWKFLLSLITMVITFGLLFISVKITSADALISGWWIVVAYIVLAFSEICLSPIGLALATKYAPENKNGIFVGSWLVALGIAGELAGLLAKYVNLPEKTDSIQIIHSSFTSVFQIYFIISIIILILSAVLVFIIHILRKSMSSKI